MWCLRLEKPIREPELSENRHKYIRRETKKKGDRAGEGGGGGRGGEKEKQRELYVIILHVLDVGARVCTFIQLPASLHLDSVILPSMDYGAYLTNQKKERRKIIYIKEREREEDKWWERYLNKKGYGVGWKP